MASSRSRIDICKRDNFKIFALADLPHGFRTWRALHKEGMVDALVARNEESVSLESPERLAL